MCSSLKQILNTKQSGLFQPRKKICVVCRLSLLLKTKSSRILAHPHQFSRLLLLLFNSLPLFFRQAFFSKFLIFKSIFLRLCIEKYFLNLFLMRVCVCLLVSVSWWWVVGCYASLFWFINRDWFYLTISQLWVWVIERSSILTSFVLFKTALMLCVCFCVSLGGVGRDF